MTYGLGIDCGTTHTAAAITRDGSVEVLRLGSRRAELPSLVFVPAEGPVLVGDAAARRGETEPVRLAREFKRRIGDPVPMLVGGSPYSAQALTARMLEFVVRAAASGQGEPPASVVLTCPANWGPYKRDLLAQAAQLAGLPSVTLRTEPEAAAIAFAAGSRVGDGDVIAVYDLGGGTFDAAVLRRTSSGFDVLGQPEGIEQLGGVDFDEAVFEHVVSALPADLLEGADDPASLAALARLRRDCVEAKEALSEDTEVMIPVALPSMHTRIRLTRAEFEDMIRPALTETIGATRRALRSAGVEQSGVSAFLLSGGSSRIPLVSQLLSTEFGRPVLLDPHPEHSIALGAARVSLLGQGDSPLPRSSAPLRPVKPLPARGAPSSGKPVTPGSAHSPGKPVIPGSAHSPGKPVTPGGARSPGKPVTPGSAPSPGGAVFSGKQGASFSQGKAAVSPQGQAAQGAPAGVPVLPGGGQSTGGATDAAAALTGGKGAPAGIHPQSQQSKGAATDVTVLLPDGQRNAGAGSPLAAGVPERTERRRLVLGVFAAVVSLLVISIAGVYLVSRLSEDRLALAEPPAATKPAAVCGFTDDFAGDALDAKWERTRKDADVTLAGGAVTMVAPEGSDIYSKNLKAPTLLRPWTGDFVFETELTAAPDQFYQGAGLVLWTGKNSGYMRLELGFGDVTAIANEYNNGGKHVKPHPPFKAGPGTVRTNADRVVLQLRRTGDSVDARWRRPDEATYTDLGAVELDLADTVKVGLSVLNKAQSGNQPAPFSARFERASLTC